jgi:SEC-C domain protein
MALVEAYLQWRRGKYDWSRIDRILEDGNPQEDPQERLFVETVNTPTGSYKVFSAFYLTHKYLLSQLLFLAHKEKIDQSKLAIVSAILEISNEIAERFNYDRNVCGKYDAVSVYTSNYKEYGKGGSYNCFSKTEVSSILAKYQVEEKHLQPLLLCLKRKEYEKELSQLGHSDTFELHPFLKLDNGEYLVMFPANLLRLAYRLCYGIFVKELGEKTFLSLIEKEMIQETGFLLQNGYGSFIRQNNYQDTPFLWFRFDEDKVANVAIVLADKKADLEQAVKDSETAIKQEFPSKNIFTFMVTQEMAEEGPLMTFSRDVTRFSVEELWIVMGQDRMNLLNLYYYDQDKLDLNFSPFTQEIDRFAYYCSNHCTFYRDEMPYNIFVYIGYALSIREKYLCGLDEHMVSYAPQGCYVMVKHYADIPKQIPIYSTYMIVKDLLMLQLRNRELWIHLDCKDDFRIFGREATIALMNWVYALEKKLGIDSISNTLHVELLILPGRDYEWEKIDDNTMKFCVPKEIMSSDVTTLERELVGQFLKAIQDCKFSSNESLFDAGMQLFDSAPGRFIQVSKSENITIIDEKDGVESCYFVNSRCCDKVLSEIADFLNMKGTEQTFDFAESKKIMIQVSDYILSEVKMLLAEIDTKQLLISLLKLHHAMIYWSKLTQRRYESLSKAYSFLDATFDNQLDYVNEYSEMNTLTQGMIETIVLNGIHNTGGKPRLEKLDRLFALMHFSLNMGIYMDQLGEKIKGSELTILKNGRLVMPRPIINKLNAYFYRLRELSMRNPELYTKLHNLMPTFSINTNDEIFIKAYKAQFGISFEKYYKILTASIDYAYNNKKPIMILPKKKFFDKVCAGILDKEEVEAFMANFVLTKELNNGALNSDKWIQRFNRPVQITARPWILFESNIYYSTKTLYESWMIRIERLNNGTVVNTTPEMQALISKVNNKKGHEFTLNVRKFYESLSLDFLYVNSEVEIMPEKPLNSHKKLGDIDILLINKKNKQIICIEAKNFSESRTVYELIQQNRKIVTKELSHVIERDVWCKGNVDKFKLYVPEVDAQYSVKTIFLTYHENAYKYFEHDQVNDITFLSAIDIVADPMIVFT